MQGQRHSQKREKERRKCDTKLKKPKRRVSLPNANTNNVFLLVGLACRFCFCFHVAFLTASNTQKRESDSSSVENVENTKNESRDWETLDRTTFKGYWNDIKTFDLTLAKLSFYAKCKRLAVKRVDVLSIQKSGFIVSVTLRFRF